MLLAGTYCFLRLCHWVPPQLFSPVSGITYIHKSGSTSEQSSPVGLPTAIAPKALCRVPESIAAKIGDGPAIFDNVKREIM